MIVKLGKYRTNFEYIKTLYLLQKPKEVERWISFLSATIGVPVIVVTWYIGEISGFSDEINAIIEHLKKDYAYKAIEE